MKTVIAFAVVIGIVAVASVVKRACLKYLEKHLKRIKSIKEK